MPAGVLGGRGAPRGAMGANFSEAATRSMLVSRQFLWLARMLGQWVASPLTLALLATALFAIGSLLNVPLSDRLGDTDDAVRIVSVRELIAGAPWFDTTLPRIGAPEPLLSHWSRIIDAPLAALIGALSPILGRDAAELATRALWPILLFFALALIVAREAHRHAGPLAAAFAMYLVTASDWAIIQFIPGRIDHHNAQVLCAVAGLLFLARTWEDKYTGWIAGGLFGLGLAIGYEAMALVASALAIAALIAVWHPRQGAGVAWAATAATAVLFVAFISTVPPGRWLDARCDTLSLNLVVLATIATTGLWAAMSGSANRIVRLAILGASGGAGLAVYVAFEPACLSGPYGQVDAAIKTIFLDRVRETQTVWNDAGHPARAFASVAFIFAGAATQLVLWQRQPNAANGLMAVCVVLATALGAWQVRLLPYCAWLAAVPLAVWAARLPRSASISAPLMGLTVLMLLSHATLDAGLSALSSAFRTEPLGPYRPADPSESCYTSSNVRRLAGLPPGLISGDISLGPFIVALSPHRVVAAPYHRLDRGILANHAILHGTPGQALPQLRSLGVSYVVLCAAPPPQGNDGSLRARLLGNEPPQFLHELELPPGTSIRVWKVVPSPDGA
jgi:hypothetical protein